MNGEFRGALSYLVRYISANTSDIVPMRVGIKSLHSLRLPKPANLNHVMAAGDVFRFGSWPLNSSSLCVCAVGA